MNRTSWRWGAVVAAACAAAACGDGTGPGPGTVYLLLNGPVASRSAQVRIVGAQTAIAAGGPNVRLFTTPLGGDTIVVVAVAAQGHSLSESAVLTLAVPSTSAARGYPVTLLQLAAPDYSLLNRGTFTVTIQP